MKRQIEIIALNVADIKKIDKTKASRIELVKNLKRGGLTPTMNTIEDSVKQTKIPIHVMVRPNDEDFYYEDPKLFKEIINTIKDIRDLKNQPAGIVFGSITQDGKINESHLKKVIKAKGEMELTFHRAFDSTSDYKKALKTLTKYSDVNSLLTSGTQDRAEEGMKELKWIVKKSKHLNVLVGSGVSIDNVELLINETKCEILHIGTAVRIDNSVDKEIKIKEINSILEIIN